MRSEVPETPEPPDKRISWSIYLLVMVSCCVLAGAFAPLDLVPALSDGKWFWIALAAGGIATLIANRIRPRYDNTTGRWRAFYDFLLKQMPPPD